MKMGVTIKIREIQVIFRENKRKHKGSCDSSSSGNSGNEGPLSHQRLIMKAQEVKANNARLDNKKNSDKWMPTPSNGNNANSIGKSTIKSKNVDSRKESNESAYNATEGMNESIVPPMMIDNSAVIFNNKTKSRKSKLVKQGIK